MWTPVDDARLERVRAELKRSLAADPDAFAGREHLWMEHDRLRRRRAAAT